MVESCRLGGLSFPPLHTSPQNQQRRILRIFLQLGIGKFAGARDPAISFVLGVSRLLIRRMLRAAAARFSLSICTLAINCKSSVLSGVAFLCVAKHRLCNIVALVCQQKRGIADGIRGRLVGEVNSQCRSFACSGLPSAVSRSASSQSGVQVRRLPWYPVRLVVENQQQSVLYRKYWLCATWQILNRRHILSPKVPTNQ